MSRARQRAATLVLSGYVPLVVVVAVVFLPLLWMILSSFKTPSEIITLTPSLFPESWSPANYTEAFRTAPFGRFFANSVLVTAVGSSVKVLLAIHTAYALVFVQFPGKRVLFVMKLGSAHV